MTILHDRQAVSIENDWLRVTVLVEGGHVAELLDKRTGVNPLWTPQWPSVEPSALTRDMLDAYGGPADGPLLSAIMGHNLCLDIFGGPSSEELAAGLSAHGEGSVVPHRIDTSGTIMVAKASLPLADLEFERRLELHGSVVHITETVFNRAGTDRPIGWTQHPTLGAPFLEPGITELNCTATRSQVFEGPFGPADYLAAGAVFDWPLAPTKAGGTKDLRVFSQPAPSGAYTAHLMDRSRDEAFFVAFSPTLRLAVGYAWRRADFPWMGLWEENRSRPQAPWNLGEITLGVEFGASPFPETRRAMIERGRLFDTPTFRWIPARTELRTEYRAVVRQADRMPAALD